MSHFEEKLTSKEIYKGKVVHLYCDNVKLENGRETLRDVIRHPGGVCVAALDDNMNILMVSQYRYPTGQELLELPAGKLEYGENPMECGFRELQEETGFTSETLSYLGKMYPTPAYTDEIIHMYYTTKITESTQNLDEGEFLTVRRIHFWKAYDMVISGTIIDAKTQIAILKLAYILMEQGRGK
ncbi:MAG: NUDIX hydrolase [Clostridium sp.]|nr:NUDIX hydrolase [Clostridium sp.]